MYIKARKIHTYYAIFIEYIDSHIHSYLYTVYGRSLQGELRDHNLAE